MAPELPLRQAHLDEAEKAMVDAVEAYPGLDPHKAFNKFVKKNRVRNVFFLDSNGDRIFWAPGKYSFAHINTPC